MIARIVPFFLMLIFSPLLFGVVNRTKAFFAGRRGAPLLQLYYDIIKLFRKGAVYSRTITWIFAAGPIVGLGAFLLASTLIPFAGYSSLIAFDGDLILFIYLLGLSRFFMALSALDTGSSFEGMGASREVQFAIFAETPLFLSLAALARMTGHLSLSDIFSSLTTYSQSSSGPILFLIAASLFIVFLAENCRIPFDDPNTHLELTMIHEVMVLDHSGVDFAYILYGAALKFWLLAALLAGMVFGVSSHGVVLDYLFFILGMILLSVVVGTVESIFARLRLLKVPYLLMVGLSLAILALVFQLR